jgi:predicted TIM-barrel fold metal-dependent hydrolase
MLEGFVDLHVHAGPSLMSRELDGWDMAREMEAAHLAAVVIKDHHIPTVAAARIIQDHFPGLRGRVFGSIALNNSVGGLNPKAVDVAIGFGAKVVWMPTVSSRHHIEQHSHQGVKFPAVKKGQGVPEKPIQCLDSAGNLRPEVEQVLEVMKAHPDVVIATGHGTRDEVDAITRRAAQIGLRRVLVDHPYYMVGATPEDMKAWCDLGAYVELTAVLSVPASQFYMIPAATVADYIRKLGPDHLVISSDYGQAGNGSPVAGVKAFVQLLLDEGVEEKDVKKMIVENPATLLGL